MKAQFLKYCFLVVVLLSLQGCITAPLLGYYQIEPVGKGTVRFGVGGGVSTPVEYLERGAMVADGFVDVGVSEKADLRLRFSSSLMGFEDNEPFRQLMMPGVEYKFTKRNRAIVTGVYTSFFVSENGVHFNSVAPMIGGVYGKRFTNDVQITFSPRFALGIYDHGISTQVNFGIGLDFPVAKRFSIRPEMGVTGNFLFHEQGMVFTAGAGTALVF